MRINYSTRSILWRQSLFERLSALSPRARPPSGSEHSDHECYRSLNQTFGEAHKVRCTSEGRRVRQFTPTANCFGQSPYGQKRGDRYRYPNCKGGNERTLNHACDTVYSEPSLSLPLLLLSALLPLFLGLFLLRIFLPI